jgi:hypothetical protein
VETSIKKPARIDVASGNRAKNALITGSIIAAIGTNN